ncbi:orotate phosphoribosyltransferase [Legionella adelaidensis]|nr:orotate phosphoribosyltransferase [Legionella adelaidensis]
MENIKKEFIELALEYKVLRFGEFKLKSGRLSPYFFNAGLFYTGHSLKKVGEMYAKTLLAKKISFNNLFGPAYKGLPLATATAISLSEMGMDVTVTFNRKEAKDHGEGGILIGAPLSGNTVIIDDVITAGTAFREAKTLIQSHGGNLKGVIIALDRCEKGQGNSSTVMEIENLDVTVVSIITFFDLLDYLEEKNQTEQVQHLLSYHKQYGVRKDI